MHSPGSQRPVNIAYKVMVLAGDDLTMDEQDAAYVRATGKHMPTFPNFVGSFILAINSATKDM